MLEKLVHANAVLPADQHYIRITIPNGVSFEVFQTASHPGWDARDETICRTFGEAWYVGRRSALLLVPSIPARLERDILINPVHPDAAAITHELPEPVVGRSPLWLTPQPLELPVAGEQISAVRERSAVRSRPGIDEPHGA